MKTATLYQLMFPNGKRYIGVAVDLRRRWREHEWHALTAGSRLSVHRAIRKHGLHNVSFQALVVGPLDYIKALEVRAIAAFNTFGRGGHNMTLGGDISPVLVPAISARISKKRLGRKISEATRERLRTSHLGKTASAETRAKMSATRLGKKPSDETRAKLSAARIGFSPTVETRRKLSLVALELNKKRMRNAFGQYS